MNSELAIESAELHSLSVPDSPQPLQLTMSNSSRCTSPLSPPSDPNVYASESGEDEDTNPTLNLSMPSKSANYYMSPTKSNNSINNNNIYHSLKEPQSSIVGNHINNNGDSSDYIRPSHKLKRDSPSVPSRSKNKIPSHLFPSIDSAIIPNQQSPDFVQLLLEYRQVLLDVLSKSIMLNDSEPANDKSVTLPLKCQCGFTSKLSNQITRTSTYVHQLELRFRSLVDLSRNNVETKYTPKRPWFVNTASSPYPARAKASLLEANKLVARQQQHSAINGKQAALQFFSGNSSLNSSLNGDEDDVDSDEEDDVNEDNLSGNLNDNSYNMAHNGTIEELNGGGKTILEGYLESLKNIPMNEELSDDDDKEHVDEEEEEVEAPAGEDESHRGPGKRINIKTKKLVVQMQRNGASFTNISRQIGISRKSVRRIVSNYRAYGMLEKKRESRIQKGMQDLILKLYSQGRSYTQISRATTVSKPTISKIIKQYIDSSIFAKGSNGVHPALSNGIVVPSLPLPNMFSDQMDDDMDEEKEMVVDEDVGDEDDEQDIEDEVEEHRLNIKREMEASVVPVYPSLLKSHMKPRKNISLIHGAMNGYSQQSQRPQPAHHSNGNHSIMNRMSLIQQSDKFKAYEGKMRTNPELLSSAPQSMHQRLSKLNTPIVPPLSSSAASLYSIQRKKQQAIRLSNGNGADPSSFIMRDLDNQARLKKLNRLNSGEMSMKLESLIAPEADKNNNTTLANCNVTITSSSNNNSNNSNGNSSNEIKATLPPIPPSLIDNSSDSESQANLVPKTFSDGNFPAGIMNSLNPNRATKLTLEDFNIVWQLRSQHWTHNQIRKYFQQRGKSISKSSISRIMNGKQRNFQQFFNVVPSAF